MINWCNKVKFCKNQKHLKKIPNWDFWGNSGLSIVITKEQFDQMMKDIEGISQPSSIMCSACGKEKEINSTFCIDKH